MEEKNINKEPKKVKVELKLKTLIIVASIIVILLATNVFAGVMGYGNIFFVIKNLVTTGTVSGKDELLSDRELVISYATIDVSDDITMQVNKMITKDGKSSLYLNVKNDAESKTLGFRVEERLKDKDSNELGTKKVDVENGTNDVVIDLIRAVNEDETIALVVYSEKSVLRTLTIDLSKKEILLEGEDEIKKISEVELKKYLGYFSLLNYEESLKNDMLILIANKVLFANDIFDIESDERNVINEVVNSFYGDLVEKTETTDSKGNKVEIIKLDGKQYKYSAKEDAYVSLTDGVDIPEYICIKIDDISYSNGIYKVNYIYSAEKDVETMFSSEIEFKFNKNSKYSKYQIVKLGKATQIKNEENKNETNSVQNTTKPENATSNTTSSVTSTINANNTTTTNNSSANTTNSTTTNNTNKKIDNYASSMKWNDYAAPGLKFKYPAEFDLEEIGGANRGNMAGEITTKISGLAQGIDPETKEIINSNLVLSFYEPISISAEEANKYINGQMPGFETFDGLKWNQEDLKSDDNGKVISTLYTTVFQLPAGNYIAIKIKVDADIMENYKVINIMNYLLGSTKTTSY